MVENIKRYISLVFRLSGKGRPPLLRMRSLMRNAGDKIAADFKNLKVVYHVLWKPMRYDCYAGAGIGASNPLNLMFNLVNQRLISSPILTPCAVQFFIIW